MNLEDFSMLELFRSEVEFQGGSLVGGLLSLEKGASPEVLEGLMRAAHSLKGAARMVGLPPAERLAHTMEDVFVAAQRGQLILQPFHVDTLLGGLDLIKTISHQEEPDLPAWLEENGSRVERQVADLAAIADGVSRDPGTEPAAAPVPVASDGERPEADAEMSGAPVGDRSLRLSAERLNALIGLA